MEIEYDKLASSGKKIIILTEELRLAREAFLYINNPNKHPENNSNEAVAYNSASRIEKLLKQLHL